MAERQGRGGQRLVGAAERIGRRAAATTRLAAREASTRWGRALVRLDQLGLSEDAILLVFAVGVGLAAAAGVVAFYRVVDLAYQAFFEWPGRALGGGGWTAFRPAITAAALALAWGLWRRVGRGSDGLTVPDVQLSVVRRGGQIPGRQAVGRTLASAITVGGGGSAGSEGPVAVLGAAAGSALGRVFRFSPERTVVLVGSGAAAGIAAAFNAPLAGAFFALEEILGSLRIAAFPPIVVASVVGAVVSHAVFGNHPAFPIPQEYGYTLMREVVLFFPLLGVACGAMSALFVRVHFAVGDAVRALVARGRVPAAAVPWVAGALVGGAVVASGGLLVGTGHVAVPIEAFGRLAWWALVLLAVGKIAITALTLQGGGSGGLFTPSLFVGAATGGAVGAALHALFPGLPIAPASYALVGMGAVIAGATGAPITGILLVFEMTNDYAIMPALMLSVVISHVVARRLGRDNLYSGWLRRRGEHIEHGRDRDVLAGLRVSDAYDPSPVVLRDDARVADIVARLGDHDQTLYPVVDEDERLVGVLTFADLGVVARADHALDDVLLAADLAQPTEVLAPDESLLSAVRRMGLRGVSALPVVEPATDRLLGLVQRGSVLAVYERAVAAGAGEGGAPPR